jgi:hypothetical protein
MGVHNGRPKWVSKFGVSKVQKKVQKKVRKIIIKNYKLLEGGEGREGRGGEGSGGWRIVIPMPEAINFVDGRRQKNEQKSSISSKICILLLLCPIFKLIFSDSTCSGYLKTVTIFLCEIS